MPSTIITVKRTYITRTPFPYCELTGEFGGKPIVIGVTLFAPGDDASISGVLSRGTVVEEINEQASGRAELRTLVHEVTAWHARLRTDRGTLKELVQKHPAAADAALELSWDNAGICESVDHKTFFGRKPHISIVESNCDR